MPASHKLAFVVPTRNRPADLRRMLESIRQQAVWPDQIVLVDGGDEGKTVADVAAEFGELHVEYIREFPPSLARQRNVGMAALRPDITLAGYLDDDLVLEPGSLAAMLAFWERAAVRVGGARFNIINPEIASGRWLRMLFLADSSRGGRVLPSGFASNIPAVEHDTLLGWLSGGATIWRREVIREFEYDEWYFGTGLLEDVDYSFRVGRKYELWIVAGARILHLTPPIDFRKNYALGKSQIINRMYFVRKNPELSQLACAWAFVGQLLYNLARVFTVRQDRNAFDRVRGNLAGLWKVFIGDYERVGGIMK